MLSKVIHFLRSFFPINLLFAQFRYNLFALFFWLFLFGIINGVVGYGFGLQYLFLSPEYQGQVNFLSFFLLGAGIGGFVMAYHIYSYIQMGPQYPFIATLSRPFYKFLMNNSAVPIAFVINIVFRIYSFQKGQELVETNEIIYQIVGLVIGVHLFILLASLYFLPTNKDLYKITGKSEEDFVENNVSNIHATLHKTEPWYKSFLRSRIEQYYYVNSITQIKHSRSSEHYDIKILQQVFNQNHINASFFEVLLVLSFVVIGLFKDLSFFQVPASVSIMMMLTIFIMVVSALFSWFKTWTYPIVMIVLILVNYVSVNTNYLKFMGYAYGISYHKEDLKPYNRITINDLMYNDSIIDSDYSQYVQTLNNWKEKTNRSKPKLVIINTSGGGLRSATWTFNVLRVLDQRSNREFHKHVQLITGASGGMIGASYYRDLILNENNGKIENRLDEKYLDLVSQDLLNRISFAFSTGDILFRFQTVDINGYTYPNDRGYAFEQGLKENLDGVFNRTLGEYTVLEKSAEIPTMIFTPTIVNDGRVMLIASQNHGYLQASNKLDKRVGLNPQVENVEYLKFFANNSPEDICFTSVLRMSATFPYIMPMVSMPTTPKIHIMDAGIRDNYGSKITIRYLLTLQKWIKENTSGVVVLKIRDNEKSIKDYQKEEYYKDIGIVERLFIPFGNMYGNFPRTQDFNQDEMFSAFIRTVDYPFDIVTLNLRENQKDKVALSWHLTNKEKNFIVNAIDSPANQAEIEKLFKILNIQAQ